MFNSRHPDPRCAWKGGSELRVLRQKIEHRRHRWHRWHLACSKSANLMYITAFGDSVALSCNVFLSFLEMPRTQTHVLRPLLDECFPEMLSKPMVSPETSLRKSEKRRAIALCTFLMRDYLGTAFSATRLFLRTFALISIHRRSLETPFLVTGLAQWAGPRTGPGVGSGGYQVRFRVRPRPFPDIF